MKPENAFETFRQFLNSWVQFPIKEWALFASSLRMMTIPKGEHLFRQGEKSSVIGFVVKGLIQTYYLNYEGQENTKTFIWEGGFIGNWVYQINSQPSGFSARALEDTILVWIPFERFEELQKKSISIERLRRKGTESVLAERERREMELLTMNATQRYEAFKIHFAPIMERIPQYLIASYLGITPVALSKIASKERK